MAHPAGAHLQRAPRKRKHNTPCLATVRAFEPPPPAACVAVQVVLLGGQGIWYDRPTDRQLPAGLSDPATRAKAKAALRGELKSRLGVEEDRCRGCCCRRLVTSRFSSRQFGSSRKSALLQAFSRVWCRFRELSALRVGIAGRKHRRLLARLVFPCFFLLDTVSHGSGRSRLAIVP